MTRRQQNYRKIVDAIQEKLVDSEDVEFLFFPTDQPLRKKRKDVEVLLCFQLDETAFMALPTLRWVHFCSAGVDHTLPPALIASDVTITKAGGFHAGQVAELALGMILYFAKQFPAARNFMSNHTWTQGEVVKHIQTLHGLTLGIVGCGRVGRALAARATRLGMRVIATKRTVSTGEKIPDVSVLLPTENLRALLSGSDYVVLCLPLTSETEGMIDAQALEVMRPSAYLINVARGAIVDEEALFDALSNCSIAGAGIDVFTQEPLPSDSPLFSLDNVLLTPHIAGNYPDYNIDAALDFSRNLARYLANEPLNNLVDKTQGY